MKEDSNIYEQLDDYISGVFTTDYWYDEGFSIAREMLEQFSSIDWAELLNNLLSKSIDWQVRYAYCADSGINDEVIIHSLILLSSIDNDELFTTCVDSLRVIANSDHIKKLSKDKAILERIEQILPKSGAATRTIFEELKILLGEEM
jgi:hypothetical protein